MRGLELNIEFVKWMVEKAEGFGLSGDQLIFPESGIETLTEELLRLPVWMKVWRPLLLQRAIEGVNSRAVKVSNNITVKQFAYDIVVDLSAIGKDIVRYPFLDFNWTIDQAKGKALEYIWEYETND